MSNTQTKETQSALTPAQALDILKEGNKRFVAGNRIDRNYQEQVKKTKDGQYPFAAVLGCIDSRVPSEIVFDQGIGDIFNARVAGNFANTDILGSLEYACKVAGSKLILVLGHTSCGAVKSACDHAELGNITSMLSNLNPALAAVTDITENRNSQNAEFVQKVANSNVELTIEKIRTDSPILKEMEDNGEIIMVGAMYSTSTGEVQFFD
jgi:carbonic anhydrase